MADDVPVKMIQQMSGRRPDGRFWPGVGGVIYLSAEEAAEVTHVDNHQSHPIAEYVETPEDPKPPVRVDAAEDARADESTVETATPTPIRRAKPAPQPARPAMEKRG